MDSLKDFKVFMQHGRTTERREPPMIFYCKARYLMDCAHCRFQASSPGVSMFVDELEPFASPERKQIAKSYVIGTSTEVSPDSGPPELLPTLHRLQRYMDAHRAFAHPPAPATH